MSAGCAVPWVLSVLVAAAGDSARPNPRFSTRAGWGEGPVAGRVGFWTPATSLSEMADRESARAQAAPVSLYPSTRHAVGWAGSAASPCPGPGPSPFLPSRSKPEFQHLNLGCCREVQEPSVPLELCASASPPSGPASSQKAHEHAQRWRLRVPVAGSPCVGLRPHRGCFCPSSVPW